MYSYVYIYTYIFIHMQTTTFEKRLKHLPPNQWHLLFGGLRVTCHRERGYNSSRQGNGQIVDNRISLVLTDRAECALTNPTVCQSDKA